MYFCINGKVFSVFLYNIFLDTQNQNEFHCSNIWFFLQVTIKHYSILILTSLTQEWESFLTKKSETWIQIQRHVEMMPFLPFGNPWGYRFQGAFGNSIQSSREVEQWAGFFYLWEKTLSDFLHQADIKNYNSAKSLNNLIPAWPKGVVSIY